MYYSIFQITLGTIFSHFFAFVDILCDLEIDKNSIS